MEHDTVTLRKTLANGCPVTTDFLSIAASVEYPDGLLEIQPLLHLLFYQAGIQTPFSHRHSSDFLSLVDPIFYALK